MPQLYIITGSNGAGKSSLGKYFSIFNTLKIIDTSASEFLDICTMDNGNLVSSIEDCLIPKWVTENLPNISQIISAKK